VSLIRRDDSTLLVIDTQEGFYGDERGDVDRAAFELFVARVAWVSGLARALEIPAVVTEEDPETNGPTAPGVLARLPAGAAVLTKPVFAAADNPAIRAALDATGRHTVVAVGLETDVCVAHSAVSLIERGYHVAAVTDAVFSPGAAHGHGLDRLRAEGVQLLSAKELFYDWARALADVRALVLAYPELETPPGFSL
jgi:nicotinamidase-related amidase